MCIFDRIQAVLAAVIGVGMLVAVAAGCAGTNLSQEETDTFIRQLQQRGVGIKSRQPVANPIFNRPATALRTASGDEVQVYEYESTSEAEIDANQLKPKAAGSPQFYQQGPLIVVHFGNAVEVQDTLKELLGPSVL